MAPATHQIELALAEKKSLASDWFRALRDDICAAFEAIEDMAATAQKPAGRFVRKSWDREGGGGGEMSLMRGQVFEKVGVNISTVLALFQMILRRRFVVQKPTAVFGHQAYHLWHICKIRMCQPPI